MDFILGIEAFNLDKILEMDDAFLAAGAPRPAYGWGGGRGGRVGGREEWRVGGAWGRSVATSGCQKCGNTGFQLQCCNLECCFESMLRVAKGRTVAVAAMLNPSE